MEKSSEITRRDVFVVEEIRKDNGRPCRTAESTEENLEANLVMNSECLCNVPEGCFFCKGNDFGLSGPVAPTPAAAGEEECRAEAESPLRALAEALAAAAAGAGEPLAASPQRAEGPTSPSLFSSTPLVPPPPPRPLPPRRADHSPPTLGALEKLAQPLIAADEGERCLQSRTGGEGLPHSMSVAGEEQAQEEHMQIQLQPQLEDKNHQEKGQQELQVPREQQQSQEHATRTLPATFAAEQGLHLACNSPEPLTLQDHKTPKELRELQRLKLPQISLSTIEEEPMHGSPTSDPGVSNTTFIKSPAEGTQESHEETPKLKGSSLPGSSRHSVCLWKTPPPETSRTANNRREIRSSNELRSSVLDSEVFHSKIRGSKLFQSKVQRSQVLSSKIARSKLLRSQVTRSQILRCKLMRAKVLCSKLRKVEVKRGKIFHSSIDVLK